MMKQDRNWKKNHERKKETYIYIRKTQGRLRKTSIPAPEKMKDKAYISYSSKDSSIQLLFCYSLNLWSWRDIVHYSYSSISISLPGHSFFYSVFHANCQFAVVWKEQSHFLLSLLFSWSSWECMWIEDLIIGWHSSCFSVSWSLRLPRSLAFILASFFAPPII